jgi:threonine synthase
MWPGVVSYYRKFLPVTKNTPIVTLKEGNTPLIEARRLSERIGANLRIFLKYEGINPTGSFKDRGMTLAISKAVEIKSKMVMCASTGNTSASAAAYAARAGLTCIVLIPSGAIALGKLAQALFYGAKVIGIDGNFDSCLRLTREITSEYPVTLVNSLNPFRIEGQKTAAFEICDALTRAPDYHFLPVGNAGNITAYWKGYREYAQAHIIKKLPRMMGYQAAGAAPIVKGRVIEKPQTRATAIRIGNPASWEGAVKAAKESGGIIDKVTDKEIIQAWRLIAETEGIFVELASAASVAGVVKSVKEGKIGKKKKKEVVCCTLTGHGLKDPQQVLQATKMPPCLPPDKKKLVKKIGLELK